MKNTTTALIFGLAIVLAALALGNAFKNRNRTAGDIYVTGLGQADFTSDLIVWEGRFGAMDRDLKQAYVTLERNKAIIREYLVGKGIPEDKLVFSAVRTNQRNKALYSPDGDYMGEEFVGYELSQSLTVESPEVEQIERISREVTELLNQGVQFYSDAPRYYYTKLGELKIEMISKATEDARVRAEQIATNAGSRLGDLRLASMGVFQITGQNSDEEYSWGGTFNTSDRDKTASITVKLEYEVE